MYTKTTYYIVGCNDHSHVFLEFIPDPEKEDEETLLKILPETVELVDNCFKLEGKKIVVGEEYNKRITKLTRYKGLIYIIEYTPLPDMIGKTIDGEIITKQGEMDKYGITLLNDHIGLPNILSNPYI